MKRREKLYGIMWTCQTEFSFCNLQHCTISFWQMFDFIFLFLLSSTCLSLNVFLNHTHHFCKKHLFTFYHIELWNGMKSYTVECELGLVFDAHFLYPFFHKNFSLIIYQLTKFQYNIWSNCVFKFLFSQLMASWTLRFNLDHLFEQWLTEGKRGEEGNVKMWISWERKKGF